MKQFSKRIYSFIAGALLVIFSTFPIVSVWAVGPTEPVGPQGPVGPIEPVGPQSPVGPQLLVSPTPSSSVEVVSTAAESSGAPVTEQQNVQTGSGSENNNNLAATSNTTATQNNTSTIDNTVGIQASTGGNDISRNSSVGDITTGNIAGTVTIVNAAQSQFAAGSSIGTQTVSQVGTDPLVLNPASSRTSLQSNDTTGSDSENTNVSNSSDTTIITTNSTADANNSIVIDASTGGNKILQNSEVGDILTGDINLEVNLINLLNVYWPGVQLALDVWSVPGGLNGDIVIPDQGSTNTGSNSSNTNAVTQESTATINVVNNADISNDITVDATTGDNDISQNSKVGDITTGETNVTGNITNVSNVGQPIVYLINVFGQWMGSLLGLDGQQVIVNQMNDTTGPNSDNSNTSTQTSNTTLNATNTARANNTVQVHANTGENTITQNTEVGDITTGSVNVYANVVNILNSWSDHVGSFALRIVNVWGNWNGNARGNQPLASSGSTPVSQSSAIETQPIPLPSASPDPHEGMQIAALHAVGIATPPSFAPSTNKEEKISTHTRLRTYISQFTLTSLDSNNVTPDDTSSPNNPSVQVPNEQVSATVSAQNPEKEASSEVKPKQAQVLSGGVVTASVLAFLVLGMWLGVEYVSSKKEK
ncbi:MAG TPA: hypothetical protein VGE59_01705 [Patescibacteria group bacterium]